MSKEKTIDPTVRKRATISPVTKARALELYLFSNKTQREIADEVGINFLSLKQWIVVERWGDQRKQLEKDLQEEISLQRTRFVKKNLLKVMKDHLSLGQSFEAEVKRRLDQNVKRGVPTTAEDLERLGKALQTGTNVSARAVGLDRRDAFAPTQGVNVNLLINTDLKPTRVVPGPCDISSEPVDRRDSIDVQPVSEDDDPSPSESSIPF